MARIRSIKPEFWDDRKLAKRASRDARLLYVALWNLADEWGRLNGDPQWIKGQVFSYDDDLDAGSIAKLLDELEHPALAAVVPYEIDGDPYLFLPKLAKHQRLEPEKVRSRLPEPPAYVAQSGPDDPTPPVPPSEPGAGSPESRANSSESRADQSAPRADQSAPRADQSAPRADQSAPRADRSGPGATSPALLYVAGSREHVAGGRDARTGARDAPPKTLLANQLLDEHLATLAAKPPRDTTRRLGEQVDKLLDEPDADPAEIREALAILRSKPNAGPGLLPDLVNEVRQRKAGGGRPPRGHQPYRNPPESAYDTRFSDAQ